jgi:O-antigen/teichoic acid export membrane protein
MSFGGLLGFLDFGIAAASTRFIAEDLSHGATAGLADTFCSALAYYLVLAFTVASIVFWAAQWLAVAFAPSDSRSSAVYAFRLGAAQFGFSILLSLCVSVMKGFQRFDLSAATVSCLAVLTYGISVGALLAYHVDFVSVAWISVGCSGAVVAVALLVCARLMSDAGVSLRSSRPRWPAICRLFRFGGVMAINSISGVLLYQAQYYLIGALIGPAGVASYKVATAIPAKAHAVVNSVTEILFPAAASMGRTQLRQLYVRMLLVSAAAAGAILIPLVAFSNQIVHLWLGRADSAGVAELIPLLCVAYFALALSPAPYHVANGLGRPVLNSVSFAFNAVSNLVLIGVFALGTVTLRDFALAFVIANIVNALAYQVMIEWVLWRRRDGSVGGTPAQDRYPSTE